ncbi:heme exporter protein CcmB [Bartonella sp. DGB1]|uniref:heme exporter protein CcmB n=1 Tax=Bartonella sp. DGB1 TaxID=3239807 RepID=UPI00352693FD
MLAIFLRDIKLNFLHKYTWLNSLLLLSCFIIALPISLTNDPNLIHIFTPAILWLAMVFSTLLTLNQFIIDDAHNGSLEIFLLASPRLPILFVLIKCATYWITNILPILISIFLFTITLKLNLTELITLSATLIIGTPAITTMGAAMTILTLQLEKSQLLSIIMVFPFLIPLLIFGISATMEIINNPANFSGALYFLIATSIFLSVTGVFFTALSLKYLNRF